MTEHPNAVIARRLTDAFGSGDMAALAAVGEELMADDIVWHEIGRTEPRRGKAELRAGMGEVDYTITGKTHDILANDDHAIVLVDATATRGGRMLSYRVAEIYHIRGGRISERWAFSDDTAAITAFFA
jgi:ketosteroid isomerase-like protein